MRHVKIVVNEVEEIQIQIKHHWLQINKNQNSVELFHLLKIKKFINLMGRIKNKTVKRAARELIEKYYNKLTDDFDLNKMIVDQVTDVSTKRVRNKIAGFTTHLMKRISKGPVRGISLKIQEE